MSVDFGSVFGDAATGAASGASVAGLPGALVGGGVGLLTGLFGEPDAPPAFKRYSNPQTEAMISKLLNSKLGQQSANRAAGQMKSQANDDFQAMQQNPNFAGNASALSAMNNRLQRQAESGIVDAQLKGASVDQDAMGQAARLQQNEDQYGIQRNQMDAWQYRQGMTPSFLQNTFGQGVNAALGAGIGKLSAQTT